jgi:helicase
VSLNQILKSHQFPQSVIDIFTQHNIIDLYPPQTEAINAGALDRKNVLLSVPTAAGKTLIAELCMLKSILRNNGRCLYIAPLKALVNEKCEDFTKKYSPLNITIGSASSDAATSDTILSRQQILVATAEKVDALLRARAKWLIDSLSVVVIDEIHFLNDASRGPTLEILIARIRQLNPKAQIIALSATVSNAKSMAEWLNAQLILSSWRPIPLREGVYLNDEIHFHNFPNREIKEDASHDIGKLTSDTIKSKGQVLVFVNSRKSSQAASRELCGSVAKLLTADEKKELVHIADDIVGTASGATKICRQLGDIVKHGSAFHHAGLKPEQRKLIEQSFKNNLIKVICSTPTLAAGVNLPARRVILRDVKRFESGLGSSFIPVSEYKQCAGRAGRPQFDNYGEAVLLAKTLGESKFLFDRYIKASPEPIYSKLGNQAALRFHILASIASGYVHDMNDTFKFLSHTFLSHQRLIPNLLDTIGDVFEFLTQEGFIEKNGFRFHATAFGQCTSRLYIDPVSSIVLRDGLKKIEQGKSFSSIGILHMLACCPDNPLLKPGKSDTSDIEFFMNTYQDELFMTTKELPALENFILYLSVAKTTMMMTQWIEEEQEETICDQFNVGPGDIYRHTESNLWLLHAALTLSELFNFTNLTWPLAHLKNRVKYGIKEELTELTQIKGVGRIRARILFDKGYKNFKDLKNTPLDDLTQIDKIGKTLAKEILEQLSKPNNESMPSDSNLSRLLKNY